MSAVGIAGGADDDMSLETVQNSAIVASAIKSAFFFSPRSRYRRRHPSFGMRAVGAVPWAIVECGGGRVRSGGV